MKKLNQKGFTLMELMVTIGLGCCILLPGVIGYGMNIYKLTQTDFHAPYKAEIIRGVGIPFFPMGCIVGFMDLEDGPVAVVSK